MIKKILHSIWTFSLEKGWNAFLSKTTLDEKVKETILEAEERYKAVVKEVKDVVNAVEEVADQADDVADALKGKKRRGRPKKNKDAK